MEKTIIFNLNGEPGLCNMGSVLSNDVFDAVGARMFELPMIPDRVKKAVQQD
jgi:CO/xanthine dehydrogenase Mo-binding subunit